MATRKTWQFQTERVLAAACAALAALGALHAMLAEPPAVLMYTPDKPLITMMMLMDLGWASPSTIALVVDFMAVVLLIEASLGLLLVRSASRGAAVRQLALAFCISALANAWFCFLSSVPAVRDALPSPAACVLADMLSGAGSGYAGGLFVRVFIWHPRVIGEDEWAQGGGKRTEMLRREYRMLTSPRMAWVLGALMASPAFIVYLRLLWLGDLAHVDQLPPPLWWTRLVLGFVANIPLLVVPAFTLAAAYKSLKRQAVLGTESQREQFAWLYWPFMALNGLCVAAIAALSVWALVDLVLPGDGRGTAAGADQWLSMLPMLIPASYSLVMMIALAISIFYHGAIDPKLAVGRISMWTIVVIALTLVFLVVERIVARSLVGFFGWSADTGGVVAGAITAATFGPLRTRSAQLVHAMADRWQPARAVEGQRVVRTICFVDISGYTAVSALDEKRALLLAAVLLRQAKAVCDRHDGRVVKSLGDAVICEFEDAASATRAVGELERVYAAACGAVGVEASPLHSGIHTGEVFLTATGDVFGSTVNLAARLQALAGADETLISREALEAAGIDSSRAQPLGQRMFKNIPEPVDCYRLLAG